MLVYVALLMVPLTWFVLYKTRFGLRLRAVGENPAAVDTAGISVVGLRYAAVGICGVLCGIAGAYMATALQAGFVKDMSAGRGFIASGCFDLRQVAALVCAGRVFVVWIFLCRRQPLPKHSPARLGDERGAFGAWMWPFRLCAKQNLA